MVLILNAFREKEVVDLVADFAMIAGFRVQGEKFILGNNQRLHSRIKGFKLD